VLQPWEAAHPSLTCWHNLSKPRQPEGMLQLWGLWQDPPLQGAWQQGARLPGQVPLPLVQA
jgi:hypothetical protein